MSVRSGCILVLLLLISFVSPPERFAWDEERPLRWSDFKGAPDYLLNFAATTNSGMTQSYTIDGYGVLDKSSSKVLAHFYPTFSWYKPADTTAVILRHEQSHFDITEIHVRKLRKRIQEFTFTVSSKEEIKKLYEFTEQERREAQKLFDKQTDHSRIKSQEILWQKRIKDSLRKYSQFTSK